MATALLDPTRAHRHWKSLSSHLGSGSGTLERRFFEKLKDLFFGEGVMALGGDGQPHR